MRRRSTLPQQLRRRLRQRTAASLRYLRLVATEFSPTIAIIAALLLIGAGLFHRTPVRELGRPPDWTESLFACYALFALQPPYGIPDPWPLRVVYFVYPLIGLAVVADAVVRISLLLFSRQENQKEWTKVLASTYRDHVILCGLGRVGFRILERLLQYQLDVVVLEKDEASAFLPKVQRRQIPVLLCDAKHEESLEQAGIRHARALVIATNDDLANVEIALDARRLRPDIRVVLRMFDEGLAQKLQGAFHLDVAFSSAAVAAPMVAAAVLDLDILGSFQLDGAEILTARVCLRAGSPLLGATTARVAAAHKLVVVSLQRAGHKPILGPAPTEPLRADDQLVVHGELEDLRALLARSRPG